MTWVCKEPLEHVGGAAFDGPVCKGKPFVFGIEDGALLFPSVWNKRLEIVVDAFKIVGLNI